MEAAAGNGSRNTSSLIKKKRLKTGLKEQTTEQTAYQRKGAAAGHNWLQRLPCPTAWPRSDRCNHLPMTKLQFPTLLRNWEHPWLSISKQFHLQLLKLYQLLKKPLKWIHECDAIKNLILPIINRDTVKCSLPEAFMAPRTVPTTEQQMPTKAIMTMNHRIDTVCVTVTPQHDLFTCSSSPPRKICWGLKKDWNTTLSRCSIAFPRLKGERFTIFSRLEFKSIIIARFPFPENSKHLSAGRKFRCHTI